MRRSTLLGSALLVFACHGNNNTPSGDASTGDASSADAARSDAIADATMHDAPVDAGGAYPANAPPTGECENGWCWVYPLPQGWSLTGIWGTSATDIWAFAFQAMGSRSSYLHYDGSAWATSDTPSTCAATGGPSWGTLGSRGGGPCPSYWSSSWNASSGTNPVGGLGANDFWTGSKGTTLHWDGTQWTTYAAPTSTWTPLAFGGSAATVMVSDAGGIAQWLGTAWGVADAGTHAANAAAVIDATHVVVAQNAGAVSFWSSGTWSTITAPINFNWTRVIATSPTDVWVAGSYQLITQLYHWNGATWSNADAVTGGIGGMWEDASGAVWISTDRAQVLGWNGTAWTEKTIGDNNVTWVWGTAWDDIWTLQPSYPSNRTMHWDGSAWSQIAFPFTPDDGTGDGYTVEGIWGSAPNDYWIIGGQAVNDDVIDRALFHWNGSAWSEAGTYGAEDYNVSQGFSSIWGAAPNDIYALARTALYHYDGTSWTAVSAVPGGTQVFGSSGSDVYVIDGASLTHWDGTSWTTKALPSAQTWGWANSPTDVWMSSLNYDGTFFVSRSASSGPIIGSGSDMFTFDTGVAGAQVTEWVGGADGTPTTENAFQQPASVWRTPDGHIFAAGANSLLGGLLVH